LLCFAVPIRCVKQGDLSNERRSKERRHKSAVTKEHPTLALFCYGSHFTTLRCEGTLRCAGTLREIKSNQINIRLIGKIPQLTQTQKWFT